MKERSTVSPPVFRFAPSPNGYLHFGHAYSALLNAQMAAQTGGRFLLRIEDVDLTRARPEFERAIYEDLEWLGLEWETPVRRQSEHFEDYAHALGALIKARLVYPSFLTRTQAASMADGSAKDPLGMPLHPHVERDVFWDNIESPVSATGHFAWRLNMEKAIETLSGSLGWQELSSGNLVTVKAEPAQWGDVIIARKDTPTSYHLSVVVDDALQGVTHVVRGMDLFLQTAIHRLLQVLIGLPEPAYHHHRLILDGTGEKLSKSAASTPLREMRRNGAKPEQIRADLGFGAR
ncbi:MAG: tRNA glutamyl-Q(34) synthetase GluQRS [Rhizobiaceae bacterium]